MKLPKWLIMSIWKSLLGEIYPAIRAIAISFSNKNELMIRYYLDREPTEFDFESIDVLLANVFSGLGRGEEIDSASGECIYSGHEFRLKDLDALDGFIYARREY
jgi:hypothetical protein